MAYNSRLVQAARQFIAEKLESNGTWIAVHWRHGTTMHKAYDVLADEVKSFLANNSINGSKAFLSTNLDAGPKLDRFLRHLPLIVEQFKDSNYTAWERALIDQIVHSEAPYFLPSSYQSSYAKIILFHRLRNDKALDRDMKVHC
eukprot:gb/GFBE01039612.1/.p1 GENE.gb/GFBE01039612.1/~~gb/GFBE01039612.1/.p1  ORF type:complete len:144 (+),score=34.93 gb/GFBE01039612.1/:1-432(+)